MMSSISSSRQAQVGMIGALALLQLLVTASAIALPGCPASCGDISVPYPFGIGEGCFQEGFNLTCDEASQPPKLLLGAGAGVQVLDLYLPDGTVRIDSGILRSNSTEPIVGSWSGPAAAGHFAVSRFYNWFVAYGCNIVAQLIPHGEAAAVSSSSGGAATSNISTCAAMCLEEQDMDSGTQSPTVCSGIGVCRAPILSELTSYAVQITHLAVENPVRFTDYKAAFIVDKDWLRTFEADIVINPWLELHRFVLRRVPVVLEWSFPGSEARCVSSHSFMVRVNVSDLPRSRCNCSQGYQGNPYIADGCQDIDECQQPDAYPCHGTCTNMPGGYRCSPKESISLSGLITIVAVSAGFGLLFSLLGFTKISKELKQRRIKKLRQKFFKKNHGLLLQQLISSNEDIAERMKIFSLVELEQATNKFDHNLILGGGGHGTVYKGILSDQRVVAIKKSKIVVQREIDQFINEIVILSQTNHRNVVKLYGCCLETEVPLLVYEFISNGTLSHYLHGQRESPFPWKDRLRIALETAKAIAYLHSAASISVYHRDVKCENILLTESLIAKVSDFGASRSISIDETGILTAVQGTYGYLDPEYYYTSRLTEKSDVYSFGVILAELLSRVKPVFTSQSSEVTSLASYFLSVIRDNRLSDILDTQIVDEGGAEVAEVVARLAESCLSLKGEERPTMRDVETKLHAVQSSEIHINPKITGRNHNNLEDQSYKTSKGCEGTRLYSMENEFIQSSEIPR